MWINKWSRILLPALKGICPGSFSLFFLFGSLFMIPFWINVFHEFITCLFLLNLILLSFKRMPSQSTVFWILKICNLFSESKYWVLRFQQKSFCTSMKFLILMLSVFHMPNMHSWKCYLKKLELTSNFSSWDYIFMESFLNWLQIISTSPLFFTSILNISYWLVHLFLLKKLPQRVIH